MIRYEKTEIAKDLLILYNRERK